MRKCLLILALSLFFYSLRAEEKTDLHSQNEVGLTGGMLYDITLREWQPTVNLHYLSRWSNDSAWSWEMGVELPINRLESVGLSVGVGFQPIDKLQFILSPKIEFSETYLFSLNGEVVYELFHFRDFSMGVAFECGWASCSTTLGLSLHIGYFFK